ncbi:hypothetical protein [Actinoplanes sp. N902-109]|uniref:hypothetical protein n=1 Tax=Actinoplanes sp. (strain N902-109) TaxID=649831 RepID=UPI0003295597|nr:hypothetical protein [Actinoplanes sp. N902-109]AGL13893.1 hypothetical protein L083_0383 [Actinoplanes sp. N902-109]
MAARILGVHETAAPADTAATYPAPGVAHWGSEFVARKGGGTLPASTTADQLVRAVLAAAGPYLAAGGGCVVRIKLPMDAVRSGAWDSRLTALGARLVGLAVIVIPYHEPEDNLKPVVFVPAFGRARSVLRAAAPALEVAYAGMAYQWRPGSKTTADPAAWARDLDADLYLLDVYSGNSFASTAILPEHPGFVRWYAEMIAAHPGRRWGIAERGILAGPGRAATIRREAQWLATDPIGQACQLYLWWNTGGTEGQAGWLLDADGRAALAELLDRLAVPAGFERSALDGVLVCQARGCLVSAPLADRHVH